MSKEINISWKGGSRRIELQDPGEMTRLRHCTIGPLPLKMHPESVAWMNTMIVKGSELDLDQVESMGFPEGIDLASEVLDYWSTLNEDVNTGSSDKGGEEETDETFEDLDLDEQGAVDLGEMQ